MKLNSLRKQKWLALAGAVPLLLTGFLFTGSAYASVSTPVVTSYPPVSSTTPVTVTGTASASTTVDITGGVGTSTTSVDGSGNWNASVDLTPNSVNHLSIVDDDGVGSTSAAATIDVVFDTMPPVFGTTTNVTATASSSSGTHVSFATPVATDNLSATTTVVCSPSSGSLFALGTTTVNCTAEDSASNSASTSFSVIVSQAAQATTTPSVGITLTQPTFTGGLFCSTSTPVSLRGTATASSTLTFSGGLGIATTTVNSSGLWTANLNLATNASSTVLVTERDQSNNVLATTTLMFNVDTTNPKITLNGDPVVVIGVGGSFVDPGVTVSDNLDASSTVMTTGSVNTSQVGTYVLTYTVTDCSGNTATATRVVSVRGSSVGGVSGGGHGVPPGLLNAVVNASPNSAVALVLAGQVIGREQGEVLGLALGRFIRDLKKGMRGEDVAELQTSLASAGLFRGPITGVFGNLTAAAVAKFQAGLDLPATGVVGPRTRAVLNES